MPVSLVSPDDDLTSSSPMSYWWPASRGEQDTRSVHRSSLPVGQTLLMAFKLRPLYREPHYVADGGFHLLLLLPVVHHHERVRSFFPSFPSPMVGTHGACFASVHGGGLKALANKLANKTTQAARGRPVSISFYLVGTAGFEPATP